MCIYNAQSFREFDADAYMVNFTIRYLGTRGGTVTHEAGCDCSASGLPQFTVDGAVDNPGLFLRRADAACIDTDLNLCSESCAQVWDIRTPAQAECKTAD